MDFEKRLEEVARDAMLPIGQRLLGLDIENDQEQHDGAAILADAFRPLLRHVWNEAIEAAAAVCKREEDGPDRTITDPAVAWLSACVVCGLEIDALNEVD